MLRAILLSGINGSIPDYGPWWVGP